MNDGRIKSDGESNFVEIPNGKERQTFANIMW